MQQEYQVSPGKNLAAQVGGEIRFGPATKYVTQEGAGCNVRYGHWCLDRLHPPCR